MTIRPRLHHRLPSTLLMACIAALLISASGSAQRQTEFSQGNAVDILHTLSVTIGPRPMGSPGERRALEFAVEKFREYGCDTAYIMPMDHTSRANTTSGVAVGIKRGSTGRIICIGGHIDSASPEIPRTDDDGSGTATVIELSRVLARRNNESTMLFCCFGGEEQGLEGSRYFVDHFPEIDSIALMIQIDMANGLDVIDLDPDTHGANAPQWLVKAAVEEFYTLGYDHLRYPVHFFAANYARPEGSGSDHEPFLRKGIPAIDFTTDVNNPIHTPRDSWENFDQRGLQRSGDLALKLVERFNHGVPPGKPERYWLYLIGQTPVFLPMWSLWIFCGIAIGLGIAAFIALTGRRPAPAEPRIRKSGLKIVLFTIIIVSAGWLSSELIGMLKGARHPWFADYRLYYLYAFLAMLLGIWLVARLSRRLKITGDPFPLFRYASILLALVLAVMGLVDVKLALYPAAGLMLLGIAVLSRQPMVKLVLAALSPLPMLRLIFSEWSGMLFRQAAMGMPVDSVAASAFLHAGFILFFTLVVLPYVFGIAAVVRDTAIPVVLRRWFSSRSWIAAALISFIILTVVLLLGRSYDGRWSRDIRVNQALHAGLEPGDTATLENIVQSSEFLDGVRMKHGGIDSLLTGRLLLLSVPPRDAYDSTWFTLDREESRTAAGDTTTVDLRLTLRSAIRPYTITVSYQGGTHDSLVISSPWQLRTKNGSTEARWYSYPDTHLVVPVRFQVMGGDSVRETVTAVFDTLAYPMSFEGEDAYVIPRTTYTASHTYRR